MVIKKTAASAAKRGTSPAQKAGAAATPHETAGESGAPITPDEDLERSGGPTAALDDGSEGPVVTSESMGAVNLDAEGFPLGAIPYYIDGVRVTHNEYVDHENELARQQNLADLEAAAEGTEPTSSEEE